MAAVSIRLNPAGVLLVVILLACLILYAFDVPKLFKSEQKVEMKELLSVAIDLAERGGVRVKQIRLEQTKLEETVKGKTKEGKAELKTKGDDESHKAMVNGFAKAFPDLRVHSEEHNTDPVDLGAIPEPNKNRKDITLLEGRQSIPIRDITVWVDPLDATQEYTENLIQYVTTMVCIAVRGQPKIGVIHFPWGGEKGEGETVWGWVGYGSSLKPPVPTEHKTDKQDKKERPYNIIVSRSHAGDVSPVAQKAFGNNTKIISAGGAGYKTVQVVRGVADAYVHVTAIKKWDICAGNALMLSVEGRMTTLQGSDVNYAESGSVSNEKGLLATLHDHKTFLDSLEPAFEAVQEKKKLRSASPNIKNKRATPPSSNNSIKVNNNTGSKVNVPSGQKAAGAS